MGSEMCIRDRYVCDNGILLSAIQLSAIEECFFFSLPELKAQVSFSNQNKICPLFSSSSSEPLDHFEPVLAQNILGLSGFKFVQMKNPALSKGR